MLSKIDRLQQPIKNNKMIIKEKSIIAFFEAYLIDFKDDNRCHARGIFDYLGKTLFLKKECGLNIGDRLNIQVPDKTINTKDVIVYDYEYEVIAYDSFCFELIFKDKSKTYE